MERITRPKKYIFYIFFLVSNVLYANNNIAGVVTGNLKIDDSWEPKVYLCVIRNFNEMYTMTNRMIVSETPMDSLGNFYFKIQFLNNEETLLRIHLVKKGDPATSLIVGGKEENHFFFIANGQSNITIKNIKGVGVFKDIIISGSPNTTVFNYISELSEYPDFLNYDSILLEKRFVKKAVEDKLRFFADTCSNPLLSLYAIYKSGFEDNFSENTEFYKSYLKKWQGNESTYFKTFKRKLPINNNPNGKYVYIVSFSFLLVGFGLWLWLKKNKKLDTLSVQERKIYSLLKQGASNKEISDTYNIELSTVKTHVSNIFSKLKIKSRKEIFNNQTNIKD